MTCRRAGASALSRISLGQARRHHRHRCGGARARCAAHQPRHQLRSSPGHGELHPPNRANGQGEPHRQRHLVSPTRGRNMLRRIEEATRQKIEPMAIPTKEDINKRRTAQFHARITAGMAHADLETFASLVEAYRTEHDVPIERIAAALALLAAGEAPLLVSDDMHQPVLSEESPACRSEAEGRARRTSSHGHATPERVERKSRQRARSSKTSSGPSASS